ncbi:hypothetical protein TcasGA2_TC031595 [Tribolium castaneum]|uniref:DUF659 domain-containing protein n=1 Tax=Tribolium castaneum TaxID=7070 RepID=A0A139W9C2_TRICA|nr:hypothetical protein TcasGA2_TC031595 [Tribolium castaneum]
MRTDLLIKDNTKGIAHIIDVAIPFENGEQAFQEKRTEEVEKYRTIAESLEADGIPTINGAILVGSLGSWDPEKLLSTVLETRNCIGSHTAENLSTCIQSIINEWNEKIAAIVTDNAANMKATAKILKIEHLPCFANSINLVVTEAIANTPELKETLQKCRDIVGFFKKSTKASDFLRDEQ